MAYDATSDWIDGKVELPQSAKQIAGIDDQLRTQDELAQKLRVLRHEKGSLEFDLFQPRALFDGEKMTNIRQQIQNRARQLIEELMIATNGCTSRFLSKQGIHSMRRVVRSPERWLKIVEVALKYGTRLPGEPDAQALELFLAKQHKEDPIRFPDLSLVIVKLMGSGEYIVEDPNKMGVGHFGLAVTDYMHSTAPNRRYPDIITLRLIKSVLANEKPPYSVQELHALALHCTMQEDAAKKVERQMRKSEAAMLLHPRIGEYFEGVVTGIGDKGTWVRIFEPPAEGRLLGALPLLEVGALLKVRLISTHVQRGFIDFSLTH
jgi:exoribonuclease-2